jgi:NADH-quinone oxidoreductase subunit J
MTTRPRLATNVNYVAGLAAVLLFAVFAAVFVGAGFPYPEGFGEGSITAGIGYAMFDMVDQAAYESESFLVAFEIIDVVLVAALVGAVMLARREDDGSVVTALTDGGRRLVGGDSETDDEGAGEAAADATESTAGGEA